MNDQLISAFTTKKKDLSSYYHEKAEYGPKTEGFPGISRKKYSYEEIKRAVLERRIRVSPQYSLNKVKTVPHTLTYHQRERAERSKALALKKLQSRKQNRML
jgi:hypothetical protein